MRTTSAIQTHVWAVITTVRCLPERRLPRVALVIASIAVCAMCVPAAASAQTRYTYTPIADSALNPEVGVDSVFCVGLSNSGTVVISSGQSVWRGDGSPGSLSVVTTTSGNCASINGLNEITHLANPETNVYTLVRHLNGATTTLASSASAPFLSVGRTYLASLNEVGHAVFQGGEFGGDGIYVALGAGSYVPVYHPTSPDNHPIINPTTASMNDHDVVVFVGIRPDPSVPGTARIGIYRGSTTPLVEDGGAVIEAVGLNRPVINNAGLVAFFGRDVSQRSGIFKTSDGVTFTYVGYGGFFGGERISINNNGMVAYTGAGSPNSSIPGIFTGPDPINDAVIRVGDRLDEEDPGSLVQSLFISEEALNDNGQVAFVAQLADGRKGVYRANPNRAPVASNATASVVSGASVSGTLVATDADGDALTYSIVANGTKGRATITNSATGAYTYSANAGSSGTDTFTFKANDGFVDSNVATVTVSITPAGTCATDITPTVVISAQGIRLNRKTNRYTQNVTLRNGDGAISGPVSLVLDSLSSNATLFNATGMTTCAAPSGSPYVNIDVGAESVFSPREKITVTLEFTNPSGQPVSYTPRVLAGAGSR